MEAQYITVGSVVVVEDVDEARSAGEVGRQGTVLQVRRYPDGALRYTLGYMVDGGIGGLYPGAWLRSTGEVHGGLAHPEGFAVRPFYSG